MTIKKSINEFINKIGRKRFEYWIFLSCIALSFDGILQFFVFWFQGNWIKSTAYWIQESNGYNGIGSFTNYLVWFIQVYFVLFIPLIVYLGFKYKNKFNGKNIRVFSFFVLSFLFIFLESKFTLTILYQWVILFIIIYAIMILRFSVVFSLMFSVLSFQVGNMLWEMAEINISSIGTILSYILIYSIFIYVLYKLKVKINLPIILSSIPMFFSWIYFYPLWRAWSTKNISNYISEIYMYAQYFRLTVFPFLITIAIIVYFQSRKYSKR
jgi:hypothetical protein